MPNHAFRVPIGHFLAEVTDSGVDFLSVNDVFRDWMETERLSASPLETLLLEALGAGWQASLETSFGWRGRAYTLTAFVIDRDPLRVFGVVMAVPVAGAEAWALPAGLGPGPGYGDFWSRAFDRGRAYRQLLEFGDSIETETSPERVITATLEFLLTVTRMDAAVFTRLEDGHLTPVLSAGRLTEAMLEAYDRNHPALGEGAVGLAAARGKPLGLFDYPGWPAALPAFVSLGIVQVAAVPLRLQGVTYGVLELVSRRRGRLTPRSLEVFGIASRRLEKVLERLSSLAELNRTRESMLRAFGSFLVYRDLETQGHSERVVAMVEALGRCFGFRGDRLQALRWGAYLHDIGKLAVGDAILLKPGALEDGERTVMRDHPTLAANMLRSLDFLPEIAINVVRLHHERWDGGGYPEGLAGRAIPLEARLFAVVDVFDALVSDRPYKAAWPLERAIRELKRESGRALDPEAVRVFLDSLERPPLGRFVRDAR